MLASIEEQLDRLRRPEGCLNAGIPYYEHLFGRDACVSALQVLHREPEVARATLEILARYQGRRVVMRREEYPGKILHEHFPGGWPEKLRLLAVESNRLRQLFTYIFWRFPYYGTVDAGAWYLILLHHYVRKTGDRELVARLWPAAQGIVGWLAKHATPTHTGLVGFKRHYIFGLKSQSWKDTVSNTIKPPVAMIEVQGYYFYALNLMAELAEDVMADAGEAAALRERAQRLRAAFLAAFGPVDGTYPLAVDGRGRAVRNATSNPGHLLFTGILDKAAQEMVVERLFREDMLTPYGIRTESMREASFDPNSYQNGSVWPFDNWVIGQGLAKTGHADEARQLADGMAAVFARWGNLPELYAVERDGALHGIDSACRIQAWSAGALINVLEEAPLL
jgi:glycogen debranching enzyme